MLVAYGGEAACTGLGDWLVLTLKILFSFWLDPEDTDARTRLLVGLLELVPAKPCVSGDRCVGEDHAE